MALEGLKRLRLNGNFTEPAACKDVLAEYRAESNPAKVFLRENVIAARGKSVLCAELYQRYSGSCKQDGHEVLNATQFGKEVRKQFSLATRTRVMANGRRSWCYMGLDYEPHASAQNSWFASSGTVGAA